METRYKSLKYAYKSSPMAEKLNKGNGCWLVDDMSGLPPIPFDDHEKLQALRLFECINLPISSDSFTRDSDIFKNQDSSIPENIKGLPI